jgi:subtilisin family serine protease
MKKSAITILLTLVMPLIVFAADYQPGELLVILKDTTPAALAQLPSLAPILQRHGFGETQTLSLGMGDEGSRYLRLSARADLDVMAAREEFAATGLFKAVSPNWLMHPFLMPNDPMLGNQWHITNNSAGIKLPQAWDMNTGDTSTVIAILDTGLDWSHPDIAGNAWHNPGEIPNNGTDDDANGFVDDIYGWDCGRNDNDPRPEVYVEGGIDVGFHGTHCGGIASAVTNNSVGVAGAGWNCKLMGLKLTGGADPFSVASVTMAFNYAINNGADVVSMSFGGNFSDFGFMQTLVNDANAAGVICVAAAGNNNTSAIMYPAGLDHVISVGATNSSNQRASFSTYGNWVDVAAPGEHIWSTIMSNYEVDFLTGLLFMLNYEWDGENPYMYCDGTSMACPLVAGVAGLVKSSAPWMDTDDMDAHLKATGDNVSYDQPIGVKVNAFGAVTGLGTGLEDDLTTAFGLRGNWPNPFNPRTTIRFSLETAGPVHLAIYDASGHLVRVLADRELDAGQQSAEWDGRNLKGQPMPSGVYFVRLNSAEGVDRQKMMMLK